METADDGSQSYQKEISVEPPYILRSPKVGGRTWAKEI